MKNKKWKLLINHKKKKKDQYDQLGAMLKGLSSFSPKIKDWEIGGQVRFIFSSFWENEKIENEINSCI
mgnify:CR=1 FL=1